MNAQTFSTTWDFDPAYPLKSGDLSAFLRIGQMVSTLRDTRSLEREMAAALFELCPADRCAFVLRHSAPQDTELVGGWCRGGSPAGLRVNRLMVSRVLEQKATVVCDARDIQSPANTVDRPLWIVAVPLSLYGLPRGVIYLESIDPSARFEDAHLISLKALAGIAALAFEDACHLDALTREKRYQANPLPIAHQMIGNSARMEEVYSFIQRAAPADSSVMITGESGTGKELVARALHANSSRANRPFVAMNCAALTDSLLESELFGHEKGAFTGAVAQKKGKLETAEGGTVFLDEIGELAPLLQAKLLRVLQEREFERVGGTKSIKLNIRLLAATNRDLWEESQRGSFRQDLLFRLNVVSIGMPPLRDRREDISLLARHFAARVAGRMGRPAPQISREARARLLMYDWPGNVRELENAIERAVVMGSGDTLQADDLQLGPPARTAAPKEAIPTIEEAIRTVKRQLIQRALEETGGNHVKAARILDVHVNHLSRLITNLNLRGS